MLVVNEEYGLLTEQNIKQQNNAIRQQRVQESTVVLGNKKLGHNWSILVMDGPSDPPSMAVTLAGSVTLRKWYSLSHPFLVAAKLCPMASTVCRFKLFARQGGR
jgi:hypothetical protein